MEIYATSKARAGLFKLIDQINNSHEPVYIVGKKHKAVLLSENDYRAIVETLYLTSIPGMKDSILRASKKPLREFTDKIDLENV